MTYFDTHCHIHEILGDPQADHSVSSKWHEAGITDASVVIEEAKKAGVEHMICVGTTLADSQLCVKFVQDHAECSASIGIHPHEARVFNEIIDGKQAFELLVNEPKVIAVGECGLDYFYEHSPRKDQKEVLEFQLQVARDHNLPAIFHVRDAFDDFWPILDNFSGITGVVHSFTAHQKQLGEALTRGLHIGLNGIITFTKDDKQLQAAKNVPLERLVLETDAPFLTPEPYRGTICKPKHVVETASYLSGIRNEPLEKFAAQTTRNAKELFRL